MVHVIHSQAFTSAMQVFSVNHITSLLHYLQSNGLAEKYVQIVKCLFNKAKEEGKDLYKCVMIYCNTPISGSMQLPMQILQEISARGKLPMSQMQLENSLEYNLEVLRNSEKHEVLHTHNSNVGQGVLYKDSVTKQWNPPVITCLCHERRKTQAHLKPYIPQGKNLQSTQSVSQLMAQSDHMEEFDHTKTAAIIFFTTTFYSICSICIILIAYYTIFLCTIYTLDLTGYICMIFKGSIHNLLVNS